MLNTIKTKIFAAILSTAILISGISTIPVYAKGLSNAVKKEYTKVLKKYILKEKEGAPIVTYQFMITDVNNDSKKDLFLWKRWSAEVPGEIEVYVNKNNRISKAKIYYFDSDTNKYKTMDNNAMDMFGSGIKVFKNYIMGTFGRTYQQAYDDKSYAEEAYDIYKSDGKGNIKRVYSGDKLGIADNNLKFVRIDQEEYEKVQNGRIKKISKKEFNNFASKFKEVKEKWQFLSEETIKKYVK